MVNNIRIAAFNDTNYLTLLLFFRNNSLSDMKINRRLLIHNPSIMSWRTGGGAGRGGAGGGEERGGKVG